MDLVTRVEPGFLFYKSRKEGRVYQGVPLWLAFDPQTTYYYCRNAQGFHQESYQKEEKWEEAVCNYNVFEVRKPLKVLHVSPETVGELWELYPFMEQFLQRKGDAFIRSSRFETDYEALEEVCSLPLDGIEFVGMSGPSGGLWPDEIAICASSSHKLEIVEEKSLLLTDIIDIYPPKERLLELLRLSNVMDVPPEMVTFYAGTTSVAEIDELVDAMKQVYGSYVVRNWIKIRKSVIESQKSFVLAEGTEVYQPERRIAPFFFHKGNVWTLSSHLTGKKSRDTEVGYYYYETKRDLNVMNAGNVDNFVTRVPEEWDAVRFVIRKIEMITFKNQRDLTLPVKEYTSPEKEEELAREIMEFNFGVTGADLKLLTVIYLGREGFPVTEEMFGEGLDERTEEEIDTFFDSLPYQANYLRTHWQKLSF